MRKFLFAAAVAVLGATAQTPAHAADVICYNCPPEWADWGTQLRAIKAKTGITVPPDNKNSGQSLAQLVAEKSSPVTLSKCRASSKLARPVAHPRSRALRAGLPAMAAIASSATARGKLGTPKYSSP